MLFRHHQVPFWQLCYVEGLYRVGGNNQEVPVSHPNSHYLRRTRQGSWSRKQSPNYVLCCVIREGIQSIWQSSVALILLRFLGVEDLLQVESEPINLCILSFTYLRCRRSILISVSSWEWHQCLLYVHVCIQTYHLFQREDLGGTSSNSGFSIPHSHPMLQLLIYNSEVLLKVRS